MQPDWLPEPPPQTPKSPYSDFITAVTWKFASTMPKHPHEYVVRWNIPELDREFCLFAQHIRLKGYDEFFFRKKLMYLDINGYKYWTMGSPIHFSIEEARAAGDNTTYILNRAKI